MLLINEKVLKSLFHSRIGVNSIDLNLNDGLTHEQRKRKDELYIRRFVFGNSVYKIHKLHELVSSDGTISNEVRTLVNELYNDVEDGGADGG